MSDISWTIVKVTLDQLQPWEGNPKTSTAKNQAQLNDSADDLGQFQTIAIGPFDGNGKAPVYDGHQRLSAWKAKHGGKLVVQALQSSRPLTDQERRKIAIYSRQIGAWDWDVLSAWEPTELTAWGFDVDLLRDWGRDYSNLREMLELPPTEAANDPYAEWEGMPEFEQDDKTSFQAIHVHFKNAEEVAEFGKLIGQSLTNKTRSIWFSQREKMLDANERYSA